MFFKYIVVLLALVLTACESVPTKTHVALSPEEEALVLVRLPLVHDMQAFEQTLGLAQTGNFRAYEPTLPSYALCYRAGVLSLDGYFASIPADACNTESGVFDAFLFRAEALATINTPITASLLRLPTSRFVMVVFHEDFHEQMIGVPTSTINESATTLMGLLYAREYMRMHHGVNSAEYLEFTANIASYRESARIEAQYAEKLSVLYRRVSLGKLSHEFAVVEKKELFMHMRKECAPYPTTVLRSCMTVTNNAELSYDLDYSRHFELFYQLYLSCGEDVRKTGLAISALAHEKLSEDAYIRRTQKLTQNRCTDLR